MKKSAQSFQWNQVTPLSKYLAMVLFVALPFTGFILGINYQKSIVPTDRESEPTSVSDKNGTIAESGSLPSPKPSNKLKTSPAPTATAFVASAKLISIDSWQTVDSGAFVVKAPTNFSFHIFSPEEVGFYNNPKPEGTQELSVRRRGQTQYGDRYQYIGGSRREWWLKENREDSDHGQPKFTFVEKNYGNVNGLEVSTDGIKTAILVGNGSKIYEFNDGSNGQSWSTLETMVSTFKEK